jgi:hypothetical protein
MCTFIQYRSWKRFCFGALLLCSKHNLGVEADERHAKGTPCVLMWE